MKIPKHYYSWTTLIGVAIAATSFALIIFLFLVSFFFAEGDAYSGIFIYIVLPVIMFIGLIMIPIGITVKRRKEKKEQVEREFKFPVVNLNEPKQRSIVFFVTIGLAIFLVMSALGSYKVFHYTESNEFCGTMCHKVMEPEHVAYQNSAHARVMCVECHVGSGTNWYVKSKLSGLYQVYSVLFEKYSRPIETPIHNLRPAQETCEKCHWPEKFYDRKFVMHKHYLADEENTEWDIGLLMKTSPPYSALGQSEGIHWHINPDVKIEYIPSSRKRDTILWVKYTNLKTGEETIYHDENSPLENPDQQLARTMDCLDCHNRPSHDYRSPRYYFDNALTAGYIPKDLPDIKIASMEVLRQDYPDKDSAFKGIEAGIKEYYEIMYEEIYDTNMATIEKSIEKIQEEYALNVFPAMNVNWKEYPNHLGHLESNGCYRCHNDTFKSDNGRIISRDCNLCHSIVQQGTPGNMELAIENGALEFKHPINIKGKWETVFCAECHRDLYE
jgi:nitrate/TMAO reductase-like tetraheme cytochrome c subunit